MRWLRLASLVVATAVVAGGCAAGNESPTAGPGKAVRVVSVTAVNDRTRNLVIDSPSVGTVRVRLLLPVGFEADPNRRWSVLYLLHGKDDTYLSWTRSTDIATLTAGLPLLVMMPDGGMEGYYSNWFNHGRQGPPAWETFHLVELRTVLDRDWRPSDHRAVAGLSMGGLGAILYVAHSPHLFRAAASFSGILDTADWQFPACLWGDRNSQAGIWRQHNPIERAADLRGISLFVSYGNGDPGPLDLAGTDPSGKGGQIERTLARRNAAFIHRLSELGIPAEVDAYGPGTHSWPYWQRELHRALPGIMRALRP
jgi:S-formylglutathione hydrolase FrmB